jgi:hypothetical protein
MIEVGFAMRNSPCVRERLTAIYRACGAKHSFKWSANPGAHTNTPFGDLLDASVLASATPQPPQFHQKRAGPCDYFILDPPFIVEFDESQHFWQPRLITLANYRSASRYHAGKNFAATLTPKMNSRSTATSAALCTTR